MNQHHDLDAAVERVIEPKWVVVLLTQPLADRLQTLRPSFVRRQDEHPRGARNGDELTIYVDHLAPGLLKAIVAGAYPIGHVKDDPRTAEVLGFGD